MSIFPKDQLLAAPRGAPFFPPPDPEIERKAAYQAQFEKSLRSVANSLVVYSQHSNKEGRIDLYRYHFSPGAYQCKGEWLKPYLEQLIGPRADAVRIIQSAFENAFPGFKRISVVEIKDYDWNYIVEIDMN